MVEGSFNASSLNDTSAVDYHIIDKSISIVIQNLTTRNEERLLISDTDLSYFTMINTWGLGQCVTILGLIVNVLNVITFVKQGLKDSVNIGLLGLTISDLGSLVLHFLINLCWTPPIMRMDLPFYPQQVMYFIFWTHIFFTRVTTGMTAWIAFERCLCIVAPLKIKSIVTPRRTITVIVVLYVTMAAAVSPMFYTTRLKWMFDVGRNKSVLGVTKIPEKDKIERVAFWGNNLLPTFFFILIVIFTAVLVRSLRNNSKWRQQTTSSSKSNVVSNRDAKVSKIVLIISAVFILCYFPSAVAFLFILMYPSVGYTGRQKNFMIATFSILFHLEGINASVNFFIYLSMSSKFKVTLSEMFCMVKAEEENMNERTGS